MKWQQKKTNSDFTADGSTKLKDATAMQAEQIRQEQADGSNKLMSQIRTKLASGKKLTREEMEFLQKNDPQTYQKVKAIEAEQKSYENELKKCKTKEEVQRAQMNRTAASLSVVNSVEHNPAIPEGQKLALIWQEHMKNMAFEESTRAFIESGRYAQLPTEAEKQAAEKELEEAKKEELGIEDPAERTEETESADNAESTSVEEEIKADHTESTAGTDLPEKESSAHHTGSEKTAVKIKETAVHDAVRKSRAALQERRMTRAAAETTPEALKVKRAKAQAAYTGHQTELPAQMINLKIE